MSEDLRDLCDHEESVDLLSACESSKRDFGRGKMNSSVGTGARGRLIATPGLSKMYNVRCWSASGSSSLSPFLHGV